MNIVFFLLPFALFLGLGFAGVFIWGVRNGQYDDLETPAHRILIDDERKKK